MQDAQMSVIVQRVVEAGLASPDTIVGYSPAEVSLLEDDLGFSLPPSYREFLLTMGHGCGEFFKGSDVFFRTYKGLIELREWAQELLREDGSRFVLPSSSFVFFMHQGYIFYFFSTEGEDTAIYSYMEGNMEPKWSNANIYDLLTQGLDRHPKPS